MIIREFENQDIDWFTTLYLQNRQELDGSPELALQYNTKSKILVIPEIAFIKITICYDALFGCEDVYINQLAVKEKHKNLGYGTILVKCILEMFPKDNIVVATYGAADFYKRLKFVELGSMEGKEGCWMTLLVKYASN